MTYIPEDPVQLWINRVRKFALTLMDENITISAGMNTPNQIVSMPLDFERQNEEVISRRVAQHRSSLLLACEVTTLHLLKTFRKELRATRLASNR